MNKNIIDEIRNLNNDELRNLLKEVSMDNSNHKLSPIADRLFRYYSDDNWKLGLDRFSEIRKTIEIVVIKRIENDEL